MERISKKLQYNKFTKRMQKKLVVLFILVLLAFVGLSVRLILITRTNEDSYKKQVLSQQSYDSRTLPYRRGEIVDAKGTPLAVSEKVYNLILDTKVLLTKGAYLEPTIAALKECFNIDEEAVRTYIANNPASQYYVLAKRLSADEVSVFTAMQANTEEYPNIKGIWFEDEYKRVYPYGNLACHVIGFTGRDNIGTYGLEEYYNHVLNGTNGREYGYLNDDATLERTIKPDVDGHTIVTTIDVNIQNIVEKYIKEFNDEYKGNEREGEEGSAHTGVIMMDPNTGAILAMAEYPNFDLNNPRDISAYYTEEELAEMDEEMLQECWAALWKNYCISDTYEPGSTAKSFTMAAGLETGGLTGNETYICEGGLVVDDTRPPVRCNNRYGHGTLDFSGALESSCNVAFMQMGFAIGKEAFSQFQSIFNFGLKTNIDLAGEARTDVLLHDENMVKMELATGSFGQGYNVTMIQMASAFCSLINGGYYYQPHVVSKVLNADGATVQNIEPRVLKQTVSAATSARMVGYLNAVVATGTGNPARPAGYTMGGKTGTAETLPRGNKQYVVSFIGYAPADNPQVVIYVVVDRPNVADQPHSSYAMGITRKIMTEVLPYMHIFMTEELSDTERQELEDSKIPVETPVIEDGTEDIPAENAETTEPTEQGESVVEIDPETGYAIDPLTGEFLDPVTGQPIDPGSSVFE